MTVWGRAGAAMATLDAGSDGRNAGRRALVLAVFALVVAGVSIGAFFAGGGSFMPFVLLAVLGAIVPVICLISLVFAGQAILSGQGVAAGVAGVLLDLMLLGCLGAVFWIAFSAQTGAPA